MRLLGHRNQGWLGDHRREAHSKAEGQENDQGTAPGKLIRQALSEREDAKLEPLQKQGNTDGNHKQAGNHAEQVLWHLLENGDLKERHHDHNGKQVLQCVQE